MINDKLQNKVLNERKERFNLNSHRIAKATKKITHEMGIFMKHERGRRGECCH